MVHKVRTPANARRLSANRLILELIENVMEAQGTGVFQPCRERFRSQGDAMGQMIFRR
jgi:hypothetical protein